MAKKSRSSAVPHHHNILAVIIMVFFLAAVAVVVWFVQKPQDTRSRAEVTAQCHVGTQIQGAPSETATFPFDVTVSPGGESYISMHVNGQKVEPSVGSNGKYVWTINPQEPVVPRSTVSLQYIINDPTDYPADAPYLPPMKICDTKTITYTGKNTYVASSTPPTAFNKVAYILNGNPPGYEVEYYILTKDGGAPRANEEFAVRINNRKKGIHYIGLLVDFKNVPSFSGGGEDGTEWRLTLPEGSHPVQLFGWCDYKQDGIDCTNSSTPYGRASVYVYK